MEALSTVSLVFSIAQLSGVGAQFLDYRPNGARAEAKTLLQRLHSSSRNTSSIGYVPCDYQGPSTFVLPVQLEDLFINAKPDTGSEVDVISSSVVEKISCEVDTKQKTRLRLANGRNILSKGTVTLPFKFEKEQTSYRRKFHVVPRCPCEIILGKDFLNTTQTLQKFTSRLKKIPYILPSKLCLLGSQRSYVSGMLNNVSVDAFPDTGSDLNLVSKAYASAHGLQFSQSQEDDRPTVELADGSEVRVQGKISHMQWSFGHNVEAEIYEADFYVLDSLPQDVVLGGDFLIGTTNAYSQYGSFFRDDKREPASLPDLLFIGRARFGQLYEESIRPCLVNLGLIKERLPTATKPQRIIDWEQAFEDERIRCRDAADRISSIQNVSQRLRDSQLERRRQARWLADHPRPPDI